MPKQKWSYDSKEKYNVETIGPAYDLLLIIHLTRVEGIGDKQPVPN